MVRGETDVSNLVLELRPGETMVVNGASIRFRTKSRLELTAHARFLFGKQIMLPDQASSPARRLYLALQTAYIGVSPDRERGLADAEVLAAALKGATDSPVTRDLLDRCVAAARADDCYQALKLVRQVIQHEDAVLGIAAAAASERTLHEPSVRPGGPPPKAPARG